MRKVITLLFILIMLCGLCACSRNETENTQNNASNVTIKDTGKNAPAEDLILSDLKEALQSKNEYASLTGVKTVKSLTNEGTYEITLAVTAETKYADWQYEAEMAYTKYDQGWIMDDINWTSAEYALARRPDASVLMDKIYAKYADEVYQLDGVLPAETISVDETIPLEDQQVLLTWTKEIICRHGAYSASVRSYWGYDADTDSWELFESNAIDALGDYALFRDNEIIEIEVDFSGKWDGEYGHFTISNFDGESFDLKWNDFSDYVSHFTISKSQSDGGTLTYEGSDNTTVTFSFLNDKTRIMIIHEKSIHSFESSFVEITEDLPPLN